MIAVRRCAICRRRFRPDVRHRRDHKYCRRCAKKAKRDRDRGHKKLYRDTGLGREQRRRESAKRRDVIGWARYMRFWRKAEPERRARQERARARLYYERHRETILAKRRAQRAAARPAGEPCSH